MGLDEAWTGQHFQRKLLNLPPSWLLHCIFALTQRLSPSMRIGDPEAPFVLSPLISAAQVRPCMGCVPISNLACAWVALTWLCLVLRLSMHMCR